MKGGNSLALCPNCEAPHGHPHKDDCALQPLPGELPDPDHPVKVEGEGKHDDRDRDVDRHSGR